MEIWDGYLVRDEQIPEGLYHLVSEILVRHTDGDYLLMERDARKPNDGGRLESTAGGSALKGEDAASCARRELFEETGLSAGALEEIGRYTSHETIYHSFLCVIDCDKSSVSLQEGETTAYKWISEKEFVAFVNSGEMIDGQRKRYNDFFVKMGYV